MKRLLPIVLLSGVLASCVPAAEAPALAHYPTGVPAPQLDAAAHPFRLGIRVGELVLADYFGAGFEADSIDYPPGLIGVVSDGILGLQASGIAPVSTIRFWSGGNAIDIPVYRSEKQMAQVTFADGKHHERVQIAGEFNGWNPDEGFLIPSGEGWKGGFPLDPGSYQYQLVVDGEWMRDPANPDSVLSGVGTYNSALRVERPANPPALRPASAETGRITLRVEGEVEGRLAMWNYARLPDDWIAETDTTLTITLPDRTLAGEDGTLRVWAWNDGGRSNDLTIPLRNGLPDDRLRDRLDPQSLAIYFVLVDRFANGDPSIDAPVDDERVAPRANYLGGDLAGITERLDYIRNLGCNTIWISPITTNPRGAFQEYPEPRRWFSGYHGYWPVRHGEVDPRFGDASAMRELVASAHDADMNVLLDFVANHVHEQHALYRQHPDWATELLLEDGRRNLRLFDEQRLTTWFDEFLPSIDLDEPGALEWMSDSALYWITEFGLDGFRHDATKHIPEGFWRELTRKMRASVTDRPFYQIGETFGSRELIASYIGPGMMDAQFDFPLYFAARSAFTGTGGDLTRLAGEVEASLHHFGHHHAMGNVTGNHDMARVISVLGEAFAPGEDDKEAGWAREVGVGDPSAYDRVAMLWAFQCALPGVPVIYYGDEIGMPGGGDPDSRRMMRFEGWSAEEQELHAHFARMLQLRREHPALRYGTTEVDATTDGIHIRRDWFGDRVDVWINKGDTTWHTSTGIEVAPQSIELQTSERP